MSYIIIKVYSFECDYPGCNVTNTEVLPNQGEGLRGALKELRGSEHWTVKNSKQYCRKHSAADVASILAAKTEADR